MKRLLFAVAVVAAFATVSADGSGVPDQRLKVSVYYESHCPDSRDFIMAQLHPYFCKVKEYLDLNLVPFGKAYSSEQGFTCQHGPKECRGNTIHNCVLKRIHDSKAQVDYVNCAMYDPDQPGHIEKTCVKESGVDVDQVQKCYTSSEGYQMMLKAEKETKSMTPGPLFVPTIVFGDEYNDDDQNEAFTNFEATLCKKLVSYGVCSGGVITNPMTC